jgi:hypothetical protein
MNSGVEKWTTASTCDLRVVGLSRVCGIFVTGTANINCIITVCGLVCSNGIFDVTQQLCAHSRGSFVWLVSDAIVEKGASCLVQWVCILRCAPLVRVVLSLHTLLLAI